MENQTQLLMLKLIFKLLKSFSNKEQKYRRLTIEAFVLLQILVASFCPTSLAGPCFVPATGQSVQVEFPTVSLHLMSPPPLFSSFLLLSSAAIANHLTAL